MQPNRYGASHFLVHFDYQIACVPHTGVALDAPWACRTCIYRGRLLGKSESMV